MENQNNADLKQKYEKLKEENAKNKESLKNELKLTKEL
jgi:hypothetical protein